MKITIAQGAFLPIPPALGGGVEKVWYGLAHEFIREGHQVTYISRRYGNLPEDEVVDGIHYLRVPGFDTPASLLKLKMQDLVYSLRVRRVLPPADVLVTHCFWLPMLVRNERYGKLCVNVNRYPKRQMRLYAHASRLQAVSSVVASAIVQQTPSVAARVKVLPNPLPAAIFDGDDATILARPRTNTILFVGRVHPEKGIGLLLEAFSKFKEADRMGWRLMIVGPWDTRSGGGGEAYQAELKQRFAAIGDAVDWIGPVFDAKQLRDRFGTSKLFVYPSIAEHGEALPIAPMEAMACGCCVVVSDLQCFKDYLVNGVNGFAFDHRTDPSGELANTLTKLANAEDVRASAAYEAVRAARRFAVPEVTQQYLADFRLLCEGKS